MSSLDKVMIAANSQSEYGILVVDNNGQNTIYHLNKDFEKINPFIKTLVGVNNSPLANGRHFFVAGKEETQGKSIFLVEVFPNYPTEHLKWSAKNFLEGYLSFQRCIRVNPVKLNTEEKVYKPSLLSFQSFINFMHQAYPNDYQNWKLLESDLRFVREALTIPTLP